MGPVQALLTVYLQDQIMTIKTERAYLMKEARAHLMDLTDAEFNEVIKVTTCAREEYKRIRECNQKKKIKNI